MHVFIDTNIYLSFYHYSNDELDGLNMKQLPINVAPYKRTPEFDENSIPGGLLNEHTTKENVWGKIVILEGRLQYTINEPEPEVIVLDEHTYGVVEPTVRHQVKPLGKVRFYVEFHK